MTQRPAKKAPAQPKKKAKPFVLQRLRRQDIILLLGAFSLACFSVIVVAMLILRYQPAATGVGPGPTSTPGPQPTHTVSYVEVTGLSQYPLAQSAAESWASDAYLVAASADWPQVLSEQQLGEPGQWTYRFYSAGKQRVLIVKVEPEGQVQTIEHIDRVTLPPPVLTPDAWVIDSSAALARWLDWGGADLLRRNPGLEVVIQLRTLKDHPKPVWMVIGLDQRTQDILVVVIDAAEGEVVPTNLL